jgi:hypothetical protein
MGRDDADTLGAMSERLPYKVLYITAGERKSTMIRRVLEARYESVTMVYEHGDGQFSFAVIRAGLPVFQRYSLVALPRYLQLACQWVMVLIHVIRSGWWSPFDVCVSEGMQFSVLAPFCRRLGVIRRWVYYAMDWFPNRPLLQKLDRRCVRTADETWDIAWPVGEARRHAGSVARRGQEPIVMEPLYEPKGADVYRPVLDDAHCCYVGGLRSDVGLPLVLSALALLRQRGSRVCLDVIGREVTPGLEKALIDLAARRGVSDQVVFHGFVTTEKMADLLSRSLCGLALFTGGPANYSNLAVVGKVREYLESALPVIISRANAMSDTLVTRQAGIAVNDDAEEVADALAFLLADPVRASAFSRNAHRIAKERSDPAALYAAIDRLSQADATFPMPV